MMITIELPQDIEVQLRESADRQDAEALRRLIAEAVIPTVETLLRETPAELTDDAFETLADQLAEELVNSVGNNLAPLSDYAVSRGGIYGDHP